MVKWLILIAVVLLLALSGCATPPIRGPFLTPQDQPPPPVDRAPVYEILTAFVTKMGIKVIVYPGTPKVSPEEIGRYLDAAERYLQDNGVKQPLAVVKVYNWGDLMHNYRDGKEVEPFPVSGKTRIWTTEDPVHVVFWPHGGLLSYCHERLHDFGFQHKLLRRTSLDEEATLAGWRAWRVTKK